MPAIQTIYVAILLTVVLLFDKCFGYPSIRQRQTMKLSCKSCEEDSCSKCEFGVVMSPSCGRVCAKGPNQICGGPGESWGICGDGMFCNCNRCDGCSTNKLNCTLKKLCLPNLSKYGLLDAFQRHITK
ncbi:queen brain-selective protein-1 [Calliopsis andreniformis]|uniref:queen brain-selective protein-1 n=1 Tax=Calliopsis andreniformis TaxID=337506 RepID=UPI003FCE8FA7